VAKNLNYLKYVLKHKWYVFIECCKLGIPWRGILHDMSKFRPSEWFTYAEYFYGRYPLDEKPQSEDKAFDLAWLYHQKRNPHHWQYWILREDSGNSHVLEMPLVYIKEMYADWIGAGKAITGKDNIISWYNGNKLKIMLGQNTRRRIEAMIYGKGFKGV